METQAGMPAHEPDVTVEVAVAEVLVEVEVDEGADVVVGVVVVADELVVVVVAVVEVLVGVETVDGLEVVPPFPLWRIAFLIAWSKRPFAST